ncbi:MAG: lamin tail domain-containing protein [Verrucomicrobiales bacterium]
MLVPCWLHAQVFVISEFSADSYRELSSNGDPAEGTLPDEEGEFSDWIEIHNVTNETQPLGGWSLTDDAGELAKWTFPPVDVPRLGYLVVFASGKDRREAAGELHTNFRLSAGGEFLALIEPDGQSIASSYGPVFPPQLEGVTFGRGTLSVPKPAVFVDEGADCKWLVPVESTPADWNLSAFDDGDWTPAKTAIGFEVNAELVALIGEGGEVRDAMREINGTIYIRIPFEIVEPAAVASMTLNMQFDDGFAAYLNGQPVGAANAPDEPAWNSNATASRSGADEMAVEQFAIDFQGKLTKGTNVLAIHGMNSSAGGSDLMQRPRLTGEIVDLNLPVEVGYLESPTPGAPNAVLRYTGFTEPVEFSKSRGFYASPIEVTLHSPTPGAVIRFSTDGSDPTTTGQEYAGPIAVTKTTVISAVATKPGARPSTLVSNTFIFLDDTIHQSARPEGFPARWGSRTPDYEMDPDIVGGTYSEEEVKESLLAFPSIALTTANDNLFDREIGIYTNSQAKGDQWERPASVEFFGFPHGDQAQATVGLRMQGNASRNPNRVKHNMRIVFRQEFGPAKLDFRLFEGTDVETFNSINLRSSKGDSWINPGVRTRGLYMRDQWHREVQRLMHQPNQPQGYAHLYINGLYWGLYHIFERFEAPMLAEHFGGRPEDWDALQDTPAFQSIVIDGDDDAYREAHTLSRNADDSAVYEQLKQLVDFDNLIDYLLINFYSANQDWDHKNMRYGRRRFPVEGATGNGFMFFAWDSERHGLNGLDSGGSVTADVTNKNTTLGPTFLNRRLLSHPGYKLRFADRVHKHLLHGGELTPEKVAQSWNGYAAIVYPGLIGESARWGDLHVSRPEVREGNWQRQLDRENQTWIPRRTEILLGQLERQRFYSTDTLYPEVTPFGGIVDVDSEVAISVARLEAGAAFDGTIYYTLDGADPRMEDGSVHPNAMVYDADNPPKIAHSGVLMSRLLEGDVWSPVSEACFHFADLPKLGDIVISEVNSEPQGDSKAEFVEIRNVTERSLDLSGVQFTDGIAARVAPEDRVILHAGETALFVENLQEFRARYPNVPDSQIAAEFTGQLSRAGERLTLRDQFGELLVTLTFRKNERWPATSDAGQTLEFRGGAGSHPENAALWQLSAAPGGTPGETGAEPTELAGWLASRGIADAAQTVPVSGLPALLYYALGEDNLNKALTGRLPELTTLDAVSLTLRYTRRASATDLIYFFEQSGDLQTWSAETQPEPVSVEPAENGSEMVTVKVQTAGAGSYWRLALRVR